MRQGEIARDDALSPVPAGRAYGVGTTFADDFIATESIEEHDGGPGIEARGYWAGIWLRLKKDKLALAGGVFIPILFIVAFVGADMNTWRLTGWARTLMAVEALLGVILLAVISRG